MEVTQELLKNIFEYKDGNLIWKRKPSIKSNRIKIGEIAGCLNKQKTGRRYVIGINKKVYLMARLIFIYHHGYVPEEVDHIDRNPSNDKIENLRPANHAENCRNKTPSKNKTSQYLGVSFFDNKKNKYWRAIININGKNKLLGYFKTEIEAALAYNEAAKKYHGEFANLNIINLNQS